MITLIFAYLHGGLILFSNTVPTMTLRMMSWSSLEGGALPCPFQLISVQILVRKQQSRLSGPETRIISTLPVPAYHGRLPTAILKREGFSPHVVFESDTHGIGTPQPDRGRHGNRVLARPPGVSSRKRWQTPRNSFRSGYCFIVLKTASAAPNPP